MRCTKALPAVEVMGGGRSHQGRETWGTRDCSDPQEKHLGQGKKTGALVQLYFSPWHFQCVHRVPVQPTQHRMYLILK